MRRGSPGSAINITVLLAGLLLLAGASTTLAAPADFERTYPSRGITHVSISSLNSDIRIVAWEKPSIVVRATTPKPSLIEDTVSGGELSIRVKRQLKPVRTDFELLVPSDTSVALDNVIGKIEIKALTGHVRISSIDSDVKLVGVDSQSLDVRVTSGDISFDGDLHSGGSYSFQTMKGDIDVTLPVRTPFNLNARALTADINLGAFLSELTGGSKSSRGVSGNHLTGGPRLNLTTYAGKIFLHKK